MKIALTKIFLLMLITAILCSCRIQSFSKTKDSINRNFTNYEVFLNSEKISLDTVYLDKDNIKSIKINKLEKNIHITQKNKNVEYFSPIDFTKKYLTICPNTDRTVVINGVLAENTTLKRIEIGAIKNISILRMKTPEIYSNCMNGTLVITLK